MAQSSIGDGDNDFIPANLKPGLFTQFAIDNLDFRENTQDGTTMHATTHNIYQHDNCDQESQSGPLTPLLLAKKPRLAACTGSQFSLFQTHESGLTLKDRQKGRSLTGIKLIQEPQYTNFLGKLTSLLSIQLHI